MTGVISSYVSNVIKYSKFDWDQLSVAKNHIAMNYTNIYLHYPLFYIWSAWMSFGLEDEIDDNMTVTTTTVTLRWREGTTVNDSRAAPFIGYNILGSNTTNTTLTSWINTTFQVIPDQWQEVTIQGLEPDIQYWFDIAVYRIYFDGTVYQNDVTSGDVFGLISVQSLQSKYRNHT